VQPVFLLDGKTLAAGGGCYDPESQRWTSSGEITLWDVGPIQDRLTFPGPVDYAPKAALSADGKTLHALYHDGTVVHWQAGDP
jgi:hypothetical protein